MIAKRRITLALLAGLFAEAVNRLFPILVIHYVAIRLGVGGFGYAQVGIQIIDLAVFFIIFGFHTVAAVDIGRSRDPASIGKTISESICLKLIHAFAALLAIFCLCKASAHYANFEPLLLSLSFLLFSTAFDISFVNIGTQRMPLLSLLTVASKVASLIAIFMLIEDRDDAVLYAVLSFGANALVSLANFALLIREYPLALVSLSALRERYLRALPFASTAILLVLIDRFDLVLVEFWDGAESAGLYAGPHRLTLSLINIMLATGNVFFSEMVANQSKEQLNAHMMLSFRGLLLMMLPLAGGIWFVSEDLLALVIGEAFVGGAAAMNMLALSAVAQSLLVVFGLQVLQVRGEALRLAGIMAIGFCLEIGVGYLMFQRFGLAGQAATMAVVKLAMGLLCMHAARRHVSLPGWRELLRVLVPVSSMVGALYMLDSSSLVTNLALGGVIYCMVAAYLNPEFVRQLRSLRAPS